MRQPAARTCYPKAIAAQRPIVWSIAGSDCSGGAGTQADVKTLHDLGAHACTVVAALTAQHSQAVLAVEQVSPEMFTAQLEALEGDLPPSVVKIGMLGAPATWPTLVASLKRTDAFTIWDPVMRASTGGALLDTGSIEKLRRELLPHTGLVTPNLHEARLLSGLPIADAKEFPGAADALRALGCPHVYIKGGHLEGMPALDYYAGPDRRFWLSSPRIATPHGHGTGCTLASAIAALVARGFDLPDALVLGKAYLNKSLGAGYSVGAGAGPVAQCGWPDTPELLPLLHDELDDVPSAPTSPRAEGSAVSGLYPIVDSVDQLARLLPLGLNQIQFRAKHLAGEELNRAVEEAVRMAEPYPDCQLYINDAWEPAICCGAYGVHLGQDDLATADLRRIREAGLALGISTHSAAEIARALAFDPDYIAIGTVFRTTTKQMDYEALGLDGFRLLRQFSPLPVVAIGGIHLEQAPSVYSAGAHAIAVISEMRDCPDPAPLAQKWLALHSE